MASILLIDDAPALRATLRELLEAAGSTVLEASDGQAGVHVCQAYPVDLVLTDLLMPGQDGLQTIPALRTVRPSLTIIAITGAAPIDGGDLLAAPSILVLIIPYTKGAVRHAARRDPDDARGACAWGTTLSVRHGPCLASRETRWPVGA